MVRDDVGHKVRLFDEASVASAGNNDPIYILRKEIHDWRVSGQLTDGLERDSHLTEDETEKSFVQESCDQAVVKDLPDPGVLHELPSSIAIDHLTRRTENSSSPETCNNGVCSTTPPGEMTSVRTCYCKQEGTAARKKDNDIAIHNGNRHPATAVSKKSIVTNRISKDGRESDKGATRVTNERTPDTNRLAHTEAQPPNLELSPETSIALENAEKIINNAKIQLMEVCATSSFDSARRNKNTYSGEPPWDDEMEERLYVRELVASKFHDACSSKALSEVNGKASARETEKRDFPPVTVRRIDLSAPKFRVSRRRRADWSSLGYGSDDRSRGRASPARVPSGDSSLEGVANETTARDDRARDRRRTSSARGNTCEIQIGPSVHIVDRELTRQDLEDVHISPESSRAQSRANTATYTLRHDVIQSVDNPEGTPRTRRVRLDTIQREKPIGKLIMEAVPTNPASKSEEDLEKVGNSDSGQDDGRIESPTARIHRRESKDQRHDSQNAEGTGISVCLKNVTSQEAAKFAVIETPRTDRSEKLKNKAGNENHERIASGGDVEISYAENGGIFRKRSDADRPRNDENIVDKIEAEENQGDRSKPSLAGDTSRKTGFPRRENIASRCREAESPLLYRTIDGHFSFSSYKGRDGLRNDASEDLNLDEIDLYQPRLDDLDSILHFNDRKIERVVRTARNLSDLLSGPEFAMYKLDEDERVPQDANHDNLRRDSSADKSDKYSLNKPTRSSVLETELRNEDLTVSGIRRTDEDPKGTNAAGTKSSASARENDFRGNYLKNSVESSVFPASDASDDLRTTRDSDKAQRSAKAGLSESSMDRSDATTFSNLVPALSSTRTETTQTCRLREEEIARGYRHADARSRVTSASKLSKRGIRRSGKEYTDDGIFAQLSRKDTFQATDRFVTYILQDEKQSLEGKVANALKESAVTPAAVQKLLDHLREAESIRDARQTETLDILKDILINVKSQPDQGDTNDKETSPRNIPDSSAQMKVPPIAIDGLTSREVETRQTRAKIDASEIGRVDKSSYELKSPGGHSVDFSECRETRESSTARCESIRKLCPENNSKGDTGLTESADVAKTVPIEAKNQTDKGVDENNPKKEGTLPRHIAGSLMRTNVASDAIEETILRTRARNNASDTGLIADKSKDSGNPDKYFSVSPAFPEMKENVHSAVHFELVRGSKNNSKNNSKGNSEAESLRQISDIRSDVENLDENSKHLSTKITSARSKGEREMEAVDSVTAVLGNKEDDVNNERLREDKSNDARASNKDQDANKIITQTDQVAQSDVKEIRSEKTRDIVTPADKKVLFALSEVSEIKNERVRSDVSPVRSKPIDETPTRTDVNLVYSSTKEDPGSSRESEIDTRHPAVKGKIDPPRDRIVSSVKSSESSQIAASRNKRISLDIAGDDNLMRDRGNEEIRKSTTFAAVENRRDGNEISGLRKTVRSDNERQSIDLTKRRRNYKIDILSSSNSSVSSTLLDHDDRSTNGMSSANARR
ncbi:uncharacterized protein LOC112468853, partial [Temnothorax curvispinosus]|uniref:Uncharacterized protein LOC112468853 n=1 Tax=Temnothorax curvispinosus TaxID=300111 RepID=A0A6J1RGT7_9HYME